MTDINLYDIDDVKAKVAAINDFDEMGLLIHRFQNEFSTVPDPYKFPKFDEEKVWIDKDKSVNWNLEMIAKMNAKYDGEVERLRHLRNRVDLVMENRLIKLLSEEFEMAEYLTRIVFGRACQEGASGGIGEIISCFVDLVPFVKECIEVVTDNGSEVMNG